MKWYWAIYVAFYGMIAIACYATHSAWPLLAIFLTPSVMVKGKEDE